MPAYHRPVELTGLVSGNTRQARRLGEALYNPRQVRFRRTGAFSAAFTGADLWPNLTGRELYIVAVHFHLDTAPSTNAVVVDLKIDGTTAYTTTANRPTLATSATEVDATLPDVTAIPAGSLLRVDGITGDAAAAGVSVTLAII